ncbi:glycoside hydrolase family 28 protein [uncultured Croceitalea sp.]|uniref:glycoside hydrolase family 28 protein n=1 Tax=uncultured Croceitalea sp. TaxID=1798908 RepID=UPI00330569B4
MAIGIGKTAMKKYGRILHAMLLMVLAVACKPKNTVDFDKEQAHIVIAEAWENTYPAILKKIKAPIFRDTTVVITDSVDFRNRVNEQITALSKAGGGMVRVVAGYYEVKGSIFLKSNIRLQLDEDVTLRFSVNPEDYLPVVKSRWEGTFLMNYTPLLYAIGAKNIAITGKGLIDGRAGDFWHGWKEKQDPDKQLLRKMGNDKVPLKKRVFGAGHYLRPSAIEFIDCQNILLEDFTVKGSPFWTVHPVLSENITIRGLTIGAGTTNDDGIDPESCKNVLIEACAITTHDDCIAIKAGRDQDGWGRPPSENIIVRNTSFETQVGSGFCIGSEMSAGVRNVFVENCQLGNSEKHAFQFKSNPDRGGFITQVFMRHITVGKVKKGFEFTTDYKGWRGNAYFTKYRDFYFQNIHIKEATEAPIVVEGRSEEPIQRVYFENCDIDSSPQAEVLLNATDVLFENSKINNNLLPTN